jgi:hypothetical protein
MCSLPKMVARDVKDLSRDRKKVKDPKFRETEIIILEHMLLPPLEAEKSNRAEWALAV